MYATLLPVHSYLRWLLLPMILISIYIAYSGWKRRIPFTKTANQVRHWTATLGHIQMMVGMIIYFISPTVEYASPSSGSQLVSQHLFFKYIHLALMFAAIVVLTTGSAKAKRIDYAQDQYKTIFYFYAIALIVILIAIPWPFSPLASRPLFR